MSLKWLFKANRLLQIQTIFKQILKKVGEVFFSIFLIKLFSVIQILFPPQRGNHYTIKLQFDPHNQPYQLQRVNIYTNVIPLNRHTLPTILNGGKMCFGTPLFIFFFFCVANEMPTASETRNRHHVLVIVCSMWMNWFRCK